LEFQSKVEALDEILIKTAVERSEQFSGAALSREEISGRDRKDPQSTEPQRTHP
jgi:hypothetical protein